MHKGIILRLLQGCNSLSLKVLQSIHAHLIISGLSHHPGILTTLTISALSCSGCLAYAQILFHQIQSPATSAWNSLIRAFSSTTAPLCAILYYNRMLSSASQSPPNSMTFSFLLKACEKANALPKCKEAHASLLQRGLDIDVVVCTNLIRAYAVTGSIDTAERLFNEMPLKDLIAWNSMISCYYQVGLHHEALNLYRWMRASNMELDGFTIVSLLSSCSHVGALNIGVQVHRVASENKFSNNIYVGNALIDMYAKCGSLDGALHIFDRMPKRDVFSWNSMIVGYAIHGCGLEAMSFFKQMLAAGVRPDSITFLGLLCGCSHQGLVQEGVELFELMTSKFSLDPEIKHFGCMVDLFGRAGMLREALVIIDSSPFKEDPVLWRILLGSCKICKGVEIAELAMRQLVRLGGLTAGDSILLAGVYAEANDPHGVARMRKLIKSQGLKTSPGWSWIEVGNSVHRFVVGDKSHPDSKEIYHKLDEVIWHATLVGYVEESQHIDYYDYHSEKLAIAFGLARLPEGMSLRIVKNLRVCKDCHSFTKFVSKAFVREIIVRDRVRFHHFKNGFCSCNEYW